ncbi:MAG: O-antigen ligase family protein, partial [Isosphaeraceae bacterium]
MDLTDRLWRSSSRHWGSVAQATSLPAGFLGWLDPVTAALRGALLPAQPEIVLGDPAAPVAFPPQTLSLEPGVTVQTAVKLAAAWVLFQGVLGLTSGFAGLRRLGLVLAWNATLMALAGLVQALTWNGNLLWIRPSPNDSAWSSGGPFACHSHLAEYLNLGLGFALGSLLARGRNGLPCGSGGHPPQSLRVRFLDRPRGGRGGHLCAAYAAGVLVVGIVTSQSRGGGFLAMTAATLTLLVGLLMRSGRLTAWIRLAATLAVILAMSALLLLVLGNALPYQERLATILEPEGYTGRFTIWAGALRAWREHPFWGSGLGSFAAATAPFLDRDHGVVFARGENEYVDLLTEGGLLGLGLGLAFLFGIGRLAIRALVAAPSARDRGAVVGGICDADAAFTVFDGGADTINGPTECSDDFLKNVTFTPDWAFFTVTFASARQGFTDGDPLAAIDPSKLVEIHFQVNNPGYLGTGPIAPEPAWDISVAYITWYDG